MAPAFFNAQRRRLLHTFFSFGAIQAAQILLPLLALPWLARALGPDAFGLLMYMSLIVVIVSQVMDWGFALGAVRDVARCREDATALRDVLGQVWSAKAILAALCCLGAVCTMPFVPHAAEWPGAFALAVVAGVVRGANPTWFYQGIGHGLRRMACWDVGSSAAILLLTVLLVHEGEDWPRYLALLVFCKAAAYAWLNTSLLRQYSGSAISFIAGWRALGRARILFGSACATLVYCNGAYMLLGIFLAPRDMGILLAADKIVRAVVSLIGPFTQTLFPEICANRHRASHLLRLSLLWTVGCMVCAAVGVAVLAPYITTIALGTAYTDAVPVVRLMCLVIPAIACNFVLGPQTLVALGHERALTGAQALLACISLPLAAALANWGGLLGAACLPICIEYTLCALLALSIARLCPEAFVCPTR